MGASKRAPHEPRVPASLASAALALGLVVLGAIAPPGCRESSARYSNHGDHFEGSVVKGSFVRAGIADDARMCVTLDGERLQDAPGSVTTSDGRFRATPLRPIPQIWHDPLSTMSFGDGRVQNLVYVATPNAEIGPGGAVATSSEDVLVIVSLMHDGALEVRVLRGAPGADAGASASDGGVGAGGLAVPRASSPPLFGVFALGRREGACAF